MEHATALEAKPARSRAPRDVDAGFMLITSDGTIAAADGLRAFGVDGDSADVVNLHWRSLDALAPAVVAAITRALAGQLTEQPLASTTLSCAPLSEGGAIVYAHALDESSTTQARLRTSERRLAEAQRVAHVGSFEWDLRPNVVTWSDEMHRIYGLDVGTFPGTFEAFIARVHPDDVERTQSVVFDACRRIAPFVYDHRVVRADGAVRTLHTRGDVLRDDDGGLRIVGSCWDITELTIAQERLERAVSLLEATLQATADGLLVVDRSGRVAAFNRRLLELWDLADSQVAGASFAELVDVADQRLENAADCLRTLLRVEENRDLETFDSLRFLGGRFLERYSRPQKLGDDVVGRVWSYRDVTEREQLLRRTTVLADASRLLASLEVEPALVALAHGLVPAIASQCAVDLVVDGDVRRVSPGDGSDGPPAHPLALRGHSVAYDVDGSARIGAPFLVQGKPAGALTLVAHAQQSFAPADVQLVEEIARRASYALENARLYESARAALVARDEFLAIASHEIRGPLSSIHLAAGFLGESPAATQRQREAVEIIKRQDRRLARFVNELVDVSRLQSGHVELSPEDVDVVDIIQGVVARFDTELLRSGSQLTVHASAPIVGLWDRGRLDQVVTSLLSNAIKFGAGAPIDIDAVDDDDTVRITVRDRGIGIAPADQARVLELFERAVPARHYGGLGVGLFITRVLVEAMGGRVLVSSALGEGSTFTVEIPKRRGTR